MNQGLSFLLWGLRLINFLALPVGRMCGKLWFLLLSSCTSTITLYIELKKIKREADEREREREKREAERKGARGDGGAEQPAQRDVAENAGEGAVLIQLIGGFRFDWFQTDFE